MGLAGPRSWDWTHNLLLLVDLLISGCQKIDIQAFDTDLVEHVHLLEISIFFQ